MQRSPSLTLIRGLHGSGKSTLAKALASIRRDGASVHLEADDYFVDQQGNYVFHPDRQVLAHDFCRINTRAQLSFGRHVFVSNTFSQRWELHAYFEMAKEWGIIPTVLLCQNNFGSCHPVPADKLEQMKAAFEYDISDTFELFFGKS